MSHPLASIAPFFENRANIAHIIVQYSSADLSSALKATGRACADDRVREAISKADQILAKETLSQAFEHHALHIHLTTITRSVDANQKLLWDKFLNDCQGRTLCYPDGQVHPLQLRREMGLMQKKPTPEIEIETLEKNSEDFANDFDDLLAIDQQSFAGHEDYHQNLFDRMNSKNAQTLVAREKDENSILGYLMYELQEDGRLYISTLGREPNAAKMNIGERLFEKLKQEKAYKQAISIYLFVRESNQSAIALYQREGFSTTKVEVNFYKDPIENGLEMTLVK